MATKKELTQAKKLLVDFLKGKGLYETYFDESLKDGTNEPDSSPFVSAIAACGFSWFSVGRDERTKLQRADGAWHALVREEGLEHLPLKDVLETELEPYLSKKQILEIFLKKHRAYSAAKRVCQRENWKLSEIPVSKNTLSHLTVLALNTKDFDKLGVLINKWHKLYEDLNLEGIEDE